MTNKDTPITVFREDHTTIYENNELDIILAIVRYHNRKWCLTCYYSPEDIAYTEWVAREAAETKGLRHAHEFTDAINSGKLGSRPSAKHGVATAHVTHSVAREIIRRAGITEDTPGNWTTREGQTTSDLDRAFILAIVQLAEDDPPEHQPNHDAGQLREELADIYTRDFLSPMMYHRANQIIDRISRLTGISRAQIITDAKADAEFWRLL